MNYKTYTKVTFFSLILLSLLTIAGNLIVDPFYVYQIVNKKGFNYFKPKYGGYTTTAKPAQVEQYDFSRIAIGSSRVKLGIPVDTPVWQTRGGAGFNFGINGADMHLVSQVFEHSLVTNPDLNSIVISTDFFMFNAHNRRQLEKKKVARFNETIKSKRLRQARYHTNMLFSPQALSATITTLRKQKDPYNNKYLPNGQANPKREQQKSMRDGYENRFKDFEATILDRGWSPCQKGNYTYQLPDSKYNTITTLKKLLTTARQNNIEVKLFMSPIHSRLLEYLDIVGYWPQYEQWKRDMITAVEDVNRINLTGPKVTLWDFSGYNTYTTEDFPTQAGKPMYGYYDSSHFSDAIGRKIISRVFGGSETQFGVKLSSQNIEQHLKQVQLQQEQYRKSHQNQYQSFLQLASLELAQREKNGRVCQ